MHDRIENKPLPTRQILFEGKGVHTGTTWELSLTVICAFLFLVLTIIAIFDHRLGTPMYFLPLALISIAAAYWIIRRSGVVIRLVRERDEHAIEVKGPAHDITLPFDFEYSFWYRHDQLKMRHGGYTMVQYNLVATGRDRRTLGFRMEGGIAGGEPVGWQQREENIQEGRDVFRLMGLIALLHAIEEEKSRATDVT